MSWLSQGTIDDLASSVAEHEVAIERAHEELETHRKAASEAMEILHRHQGLAAEAKFLLTIAHGTAPIPSPGEIREVTTEEEGLGLAIGGVRMTLPPDAAPAQFGHLAESMRALYAAAHVVALHADERARAGGPPPAVPEPEIPSAVPRAFASLMGCLVCVDNADGTRDIGLLSSVEGGRFTLLDEDGVPAAWPLPDEVLAVQPWPPAEELEGQEAAVQDGSEPGPAENPTAAHREPQPEMARAGAGPRAGGAVSLVRWNGRAESAAGM